MDHCHCINFSLPLHHRSIQPITFYFEVIKTCFLLSLISIYCSLSIRFNFSWNFVSLWLWVALDLSFFFLFLFSWNFVGLWLLVALDLRFFFFFFLCIFPCFLLLPLLSNLWQRRIKKTCEPPSNLLTFIDNGINVIFGKNFNIDFNIISPKQY